MEIVNKWFCGGGFACLLTCLLVCVCCTGEAFLVALQLFSVRIVLLCDSLLCSPDVLL